VTGDPAEAEWVRWLKTVAAACDRILAREEEEPSDWSYRQVRQDVEALRARVRSELEGER
jgi:hypothetical protein